jgi:hypothetical protein
LRVRADSSPTAIEVVVNPDNSVIFRVLSEKAAGLMEMARETADEAREWQDEIDKLKGKPKKLKRR